MEEGSFMPTDGVTADEEREDEPLLDAFRR